jgi:putative acetyltransferase
MRFLINPFRQYLLIIDIHYINLSSYSKSNLRKTAKIIQQNVEIEVIVLAPMAVKPAFQNKGIGGKLIKESLKRAKKLGFELVLLIGHPDYYPKFGFQAARTHGIELTQFDVPNNVFMVYELKKGALETTNGELIYPPAFFG